MNASPNIIEVSVQNFQTEVVEKSQQIPVFLEFYADGAEPSEQLAPILNKLATEFSEKIILARVDVQQNQQIVQQLAVRTLPTIKVIFQGQMAQDLEGPQEEATLREMIEQLTFANLFQGQNIWQSSHPKILLPIFFLNSKGIAPLCSMVRYEMQRVASNW